MKIFFLNAFLSFYFHRENERTITDQQKLIQNFQQEIIRLQRHLSKIESEVTVQPSIMFTRLDAERNEQTLKQAVDNGKVSETTYNVSLFATYHYTFDLEKRDVTYPDTPSSSARDDCKTLS